MRNKTRHRNIPVTENRQPRSSSKPWPDTDPRRSTNHSTAPGPPPVSMLNSAFSRERTVLIETIRSRFRLDESTASDIVHDAYASCLEAMGKANRNAIGENQALLFLCKSAHRKGIDHLRYCQRKYVGATNRDEVLNVEHQPIGMDEFLDAELIGQVSQSFDDLSAAEQEILQLRVIEKRPRKDVAEKLGFCERTVTSRTRLALERLREAIIHLTDEKEDQG